MKYFVRVDGREHTVELRERLGELSVLVDGEPFPVAYSEVDRHGQAHLLFERESHALAVEGDEQRVFVSMDGHDYSVEIEDERERAAHAAERGSGRAGGVVKSVMPGVVIEWLVQSGDEVRRGQPLLLLEAMKMQNEILAPSDGVVADRHVETGRAVAAGEKLVTIRSIGD